MNRRTLLIRVTARLLATLICLTAGCLILFAAFYSRNKSMPVIILVVAMGLFGGFISIQRRLATLRRSDLIAMTASDAYIILPPFCGGILAVILYCLLVSRIIQGDIFPVFECDDSLLTKDLGRLFECYAVSHADYAKLVVWSFLAGFSENYVTNILGGLSSKNDADRSQRIIVETHH